MPISLRYLQPFEGVGHGHEINCHQPVVSCSAKFCIASPADTVILRYFLFTGWICVRCMQMLFCQHHNAPNMRSSTAVSSRQYRGCYGPTDCRRWRGGGMIFASGSSEIPLLPTLMSTWKIFNVYKTKWRLALDGLRQVQMRIVIQVWKYSSVEKVAALGDQPAVT